MLYDLVSLQPDGKIFLYLSDNKTYCLLTMYLLCASHLTNVISFKPSHYLSEIGNIITEDETGSESLSKLPKGWWVVSKEDEPAFKKKKTTWKLPRHQLIYWHSHRKQSSAFSWCLMGTVLQSRGDLGLSNRCFKGSSFNFHAHLDHEGGCSPPPALLSRCSCFSPGPMTQHTAPDGFLQFLVLLAEVPKPWYSKVKPKTCCN